MKNIKHIIVKFFRKNSYYIYIKKNIFYQSYSDIKVSKKLKNWSVVDEEKLIFYKHFIQAGSLCFDIGANIGMMTKIFLKIDSKVVAVEPQRECVKLLKKILRHTNLSIVEKAVGEKIGFLELNVCDINSMSSSSSEWIQSVRKSGRYSNKWWYEKRIVPVTTLDQLMCEFGNPDYIKIDVEGSELEVIKGLSRQVKFLSFEHTPELSLNTIRIFEHLSNFGRFNWNYCFADETNFQFPNWKEESELSTFLKDNNFSDHIGDIYIHFEIKL